MDPRQREPLIGCKVVSDGEWWKVASELDRGMRRISGKRSICILSLIANEVGGSGLLTLQARDQSKVVQRDIRPFCM